jgi:hypothetical protein
MPVRRPPFEVLTDGERELAQAQRRKARGQLPDEIQIRFTELAPSGPKRRLPP